MRQHPGADQNLVGGPDVTDATREVSLRDVVALCSEYAAATPASIARTLPVIERAVSFFESTGLSRLEEVSAADVSMFVSSRLTSGLAASLPTQHNRRTALRFVYRAARRNGFEGADPTADIVLPPRSPLPTRPLDDAEVELCRDVAWWSSSRTAAAWALAEATARGSEIALVSADDLALEKGAVRLPGGVRVEARLGVLTPWGLAALRRRVAEIGDGALAYSGQGHGIAGQVSTCRAISSVLVRAGLAGEPDVRPSSVSAWAGRCEFERTGRIEDAARMMGVRSLDRAARLIGESWADR